MALLEAVLHLLCCALLCCSYVVCPSCHAVEPLTGNVMQTMKACQAVQCKACNEDEMRFKVRPVSRRAVQQRLCTSVV